MLRHACNMKLEGVMSKRRDAPYRSGRNRRLDQVEVRAEPGVRDRRLQGLDAPEGRDRRARARLSSRAASCTTRAAPAPATRRRRRATCGRSCSRCGATRRRSASFPRRSAAARASGSSRSWSPKSTFRGWTAQGTCATRCSRVCARTSRRRRSCGRRRWPTKAKKSSAGSSTTKARAKRAAPANRARRTRR